MVAAVTAALLALVGSFVGGVGGELWVRRHTVNDRLVQTVLTFNQTHVRFAHGLVRLAAIVGDAATMPPDIARALLDSNSEKVGGIQAEALAAFTAVELRFGVDAAQTQIAGDALEHLNDAHGACDRIEYA